MNGLIACLYGSEQSSYELNENVNRRFEINTRLVHLQENARNVYMEKYKKANRDHVDGDEKIL